MSKVYISFLGTNDYLPCTYFKNSREMKNVRFVQQATLEFFCRGWTGKDRITIFSTEDAFRRNWLDDGHTDKDTGGIKKCMGLKNCIEELNLLPVLKKVPIPEGKSEQEIWEIFQIVLEELKPEDEVIFDITHAFRSIPMLAIVILNYSKVMKNITIGGIYYGAFEVLGSIFEAEKISMEKRRVPILDLTLFDQLMEWGIAIDRFSVAGDAAMVSKLANQSVKPILSESKGRDKAADTIRTIAKNLSDFSKAMATCRGHDISSIAGTLKEHVNTFESLELVQPFKPIFNRIKNQMNDFSGDSIMDGIQAARWCLDHSLIQQGYTILQETLLSYFILKIKHDQENQKYREIAGQAVTIYLKKIDRAKWKKASADNEQITLKLLDAYKGQDELIKIFRNISNDRNDLNHAGHNTNPMRPEAFRKQLSEMLARIETCLADGS